MISLVHGASKGPNTILKEDGSVKCWRCQIVLQFRDYIRYVQSNPLDSKVGCDIIKGYVSNSLIEKIRSLDELPILKSISILKAKAGSGKTTYLLNKALQSNLPFLFLAPFVRDCDIISEMSPEDSRQLKVYELLDSEKREHHLKVIKLKSTTGNMEGFVGPNRTKEIVEIIQLSLLDICLPYSLKLKGIE